MKEKLTEVWKMVILSDLLGYVVGKKDIKMILKMLKEYFEKKEIERWKK